MSRLTPFIRFAVCVVLVLLGGYGCYAAAAQSDDSSASPTTLNTESASQRFVAVHGQRSVLMGYTGRGLEMWAYPFQIVSGYQIGFQPDGSTAEVDGDSILKRIDYQPDSVTRIYVGPDYVIREELFVPLNQPAAIVTYTIEGSRKIDINIHFKPVLNLMWPGALGGQYMEWNAEANAYILSETTHQFSAFVGSPQTIAHDETVNTTFRTDSTSFTIRPTSEPHEAATAQVYLAWNDKDQASGVTLHALHTEFDSMKRDAETHYASLRENALQLETPDEDVNQALAWTEIALDQAWVCNPKVGCGIVAGYGPSRDARRPQYAWFFAGDGLVATNALIAAGEYGRAREELKFITKYQQPGTGMLWHEMSQSAGYIDWSKYPYMYVHVDITFDYLETIGRYVAETGDVQFAKEHWNSIFAAYQYCHGLVRSADHLPHIPLDKEGGDEQARPSDDLSLSTAWLGASTAFAKLAQVSGHQELATDAESEGALTRKAIAAHYWDNSTNFWIDGHTQTGKAIPGRRRGPTRLIPENVFTPAQEEAVLSQLASSDFQTDWGMRELGSNAPDYDPDSYGRGSITAPGTTSAAVTYWKMHRPSTAYAIWRSIVPWNRLDSPGHIHEVLAGSYYYPQQESVPEQTWSSAGLLDSVVQGLLGIKIDGTSNSILFAPHVPSEWDHLSVRNVRLPQSKLSLKIHHSLSEDNLEIENEGKAIDISYEPEVPLGSRILGGTFNDRPISATIQPFAEDQHANVKLHVSPGTSHLRLHLEGGVALVLDHPDPLVGDPSSTLKLISAVWKGDTLAIEADVLSTRMETFRVQSAWKIADVQGAKLLKSSSDGQTTSSAREYVLSIPRSASQGNGSDWTRTHVKLRFDASKRIPGVQ